MNKGYEIRMQMFIHKNIEFVKFAGKSFCVAVLPCD